MERVDTRLHEPRHLHEAAYLDVPHRVILSPIVELPFGAGKRWATGGLANLLAGGWVFTAIASYESGQPLNITQDSDNSGSFSGVQRPNWTGSDPVTPGDTLDRLNNYINPAAFTVAPSYSFGNVARSINYLGPGMVNWDLSLFKTVAIRERFKAQFRAEALNAFNTPDFANPNTQFLGLDSKGNTVGNFGRLVYQANLPRELQLGIRLFF